MSDKVFYPSHINNKQMKKISCILVGLVIVLGSCSQKEKTAGYLKKYVIKRIDDPSLSVRYLDTLYKVGDTVVIKAYSRSDKQDTSYYGTIVR